MTEIRKEINNWRYYMNTKLFVLLGGVGAVHLVAGALFIAGGCAQEDPPMPPGIYVPKQSANEPAGPAPAPAEPAGQADFSNSGSSMKTGCRLIASSSFSADWA